MDNIIVEALDSACPDTSKVEAITAADFPNTTANTIALCPADLCDATKKEGECDVKVFISWLGTDKNSNNLISSGERFMNFKNYNLSGMYQSILAISNRESQDVADAYDQNAISADVKARVANPPKTVQTA